MDNKLDFYNDIKRYAETLTDEDALLVLSYNKKDTDCINVLVGDWKILTGLFVPIKEKDLDLKDGSAVNMNNIKSSIMNIAFNVCVNDKESKKKFLKALKNL